MLCNKCGRQVIDGANFCPFCGADLRYQRNNNSGLSGYINPNDETNFGYTLLSFFMPYIGLVLYIVWLKEFPKRAKSCLNGLIAGIICIIILFCCVYSGRSHSNSWHRISPESVISEKTGV
ncbi:zinc ribbon domain-containing protein [Thomasclavelia cocleata]|jgi:uncharacterized membrane protein YvbJ|uniref:zinc ribbon domain-containing protein n=1 Tax=Thomasclavelia cocleata TaxID=69824 RepID=UPI00241F7679|nr:zinc ribbon domain-containing protein [Thomasclavelia cocleata]